MARVTKKKVSKKVAVRRTNPKKKTARRVAKKKVVRRVAKKVAKKRNTTKRIYRVAACDGKNVGYFTGKVVSGKPQFDSDKVKSKSFASMSDAEAVANLMPSLLPAKWTVLVVGKESANDIVNFVTGKK